MKNLFLALLLVASLGFAGLYARERAKYQRANNDIKVLNETLVDLQTRVDEQEQKAVNLQEHLQTTRATAIAKADEVSHLQQVLTNAEAKASTNSNPLADMFKSPEMKKMIQSQQQTVLGPMVEKTYAPYLAGLQVTPEQAATFKDLIMKKMLVGADIGMSMLGGDNNPDKRSELMQQAKTQTDAVDQEIKQFLGDANYQQFQAYEKTIPDRMALNMYKDAQGSGPGALSADQEQQLLQIMSDERGKFKFTTDLSDQSKMMGGDLAAMFTEDKVNQFQAETEQLNKQYLARAQSVLSPDQLTAFDKFLAGQRDMQAMGMKMAAKMFGGGSK